MKQPQINYFGDKGLLIEWEPQINAETHNYTVSLMSFIQLQKHLNIIETTAAYHSVAIYFSETSKIEHTVNLINKWLADSSNEFENKKSRTVEILVCYDLSLGVDLAEMSKTLKLSIPEIIERHTSPLYKVYFLGFLPGFPYLGGLQESLKMPRKQNPRAMVSAGSVAIGGGQTGVYPSDSPGGWNIIGKTPLTLFDVTRETPAILKAGDTIKFKSITLDRYLEIEKQIKAGSFKNVVIND